MSRETGKENSESIEPFGRDAPDSILPPEYESLLEDIKNNIRSAHVKAALSVNRTLIALYWDIGKIIVERQQKEGWGKSVVEKLASDIQAEFPGISGFSPLNIWRMRAFYIAWTAELEELSQTVTETELEKQSQLVTEIPWGHNIVLVQKIKDPVKRTWYARQIVENGWSRSILEHQIDSKLFERQGMAVTNFAATLPTPQAELAAQIVKDPYNFGFLDLPEDARERDLEMGLMGRIRDLLLELGKGFAFVGQQYHLQVDEQDFYIDLLFYHLKLRCFVVVDLKVVEFKPEFAGKMNFYLSAVDDIMRHPEDRSSIGLIICKTRSGTIAEYSLRDMAKPVGVASYVTGPGALPEEYRNILPDKDELERRVGQLEGEE